MTDTSCTPKRSSRRRISRRRFLRYTGLAGLALLSGGAAPLFGSPSSQADADQSHQVYLPLIAKALPIPRLPQELVHEAVEPFVTAIDQVGYEINMEEVIQNLEYQEIRDIDGKSFIVAVYNFDPDPNQTGENFEGYYPLLIAIKNEVGEWQWQTMIADTAFRLMGKEIWVGAEPGGGKQEKAIKNHFENWIITTSTEGFVYPREEGGEYNFEIADAFVRQTPDKALMGHLVWGFEPALPQWVIDLPPDELEQTIPEHIRIVMTHFLTLFPEKDFSWTVVAEATEPTLFHNQLPYSLDDLRGSYIEKAFLAANELLVSFLRTNEDGTRKDRLAYSDFVSSVDDPKIQRIIPILEFLKTQGLIDEFHLQLRFVGPPNFDPTCPPSVDDLTTLTNYIYEQTGVPVVFTEVEIDTAEMAVNEQERQEYAIEIFGNTTGACAVAAYCLGITLPKTLPDKPTEITLFDYRRNEATPNIYYYLVLEKLLHVCKLRHRKVAR